MMKIYACMIFSKELIKYCVYTRGKGLSSMCLKTDRTQLFLLLRLDPPSPNIF